MVAPVPQRVRVKVLPNMGTVSRAGSPVPLIGGPRRARWDVEKRLLASNLVAPFIQRSLRAKT